MASLLPSLASYSTYRDRYYKVNKLFLIIIAITACFISFEYEMERIRPVEISTFSRHDSYLDIMSILLRLYCG